MTSNEILARLKAIRDAASDPEIASTLEYELLVAVLREIAKSPTVDGVRAALALCAVDIEFHRWRA